MGQFQENFQIDGGMERQTDPNAQDPSDQNQRSKQKQHKNAGMTSKLIAYWRRSINILGYFSSDRTSEKKIKRSCNDRQTKKAAIASLPYQPPPYNERGNPGTILDLFRIR